ncbi:MAG: N-acetylmuramoyl-L-alanine amidase, partial [Pseudomonadota bacterium]
MVSQFDPTLRLGLLLLATGLLQALSGCAGGTATVRAESENQNSRVSIVVLHHTAIDFDHSLRVLTKRSSRPVSSHYLIPEPQDPSYKKRGLKVYQLVDEDRRAWHAGTSYWRGRTGLNDQSIGIELVYVPTCHTQRAASGFAADADEKVEAAEVCFFPDFADSQLALLVDLLGGILERHPNIAPTHIVAHSDIAPDRKVDPGPRFPWQRLHKLGFGAWYDEATAVRYWEQFLGAPLPLANVQAALNAYGYPIELTGEADAQTKDVLTAFQMHFRPYEVSGEATPITVAILFALIEKYYPSELPALLVVEAAEEPAAAVDEEPATDAPAPGDAANTSDSI